MVAPSIEQSVREDRLLLFAVGGEGFCLPVESVREVIHLPTLARPPVAPSMLEGFLNLEGAAVAVVRLDILFGFSRESLEAYTPLIVLRQAEIPIALMVQRVIGIRSVPSDMVLPLQGNACFNGCIQANIQLDTGIAHVVSVRRLLLERERRTIADFQTLEAMRVHELEVPQS